MQFFPDKAKMIKPENALKGRSEAMPLTAVHAVNGHIMKPPFDAYLDVVILGMRCFWGAERKFWPMPGVYVTAVGYSAGYTPNPSYEEVCSGSTGHNEVVLVVYDPAVVSFQALLKVFWESHNPTQGMRQGNDRGTQYRSGIYCSSEKQLQEAQQSLQYYQSVLASHSPAKITTEVLLAGAFYYAEEYHQQYLHKSPQGYCGLGGCGIEYHLQ